MSFLKTTDRRSQIAIRIFFGLVLLSSIVTLASSASDLVSAFRAGSTVDTVALGSFLRTAAWMPLFALLFQAGDLEAAKLTKANKTNTAIVFWCMGLGTFAGAILTADTTARLWFWLSLISGVVMLLSAAALMIQAMSKPSAA